MHFEILVEDQSGKKALDILVPKIIGDGHTFNVHPYKGIGRIPKVVGAEKSQWAEKITPNMNITSNKSPSFQYFVKKLRELVGA